MKQYIYAKSIPQSGYGGSLEHRQWHYDDLNELVAKGWEIVSTHWQSRGDDHEPCLYTLLARTVPQEGEGR
jgi:hypothetical protein